MFGSSPHFRSLIAIVCLVSTSVPLRAELVVTEDDTGGQGTVTVFQLSVTPAPEPVPALKYRLWRHPGELNDGNSVAYYLRAFPESGIEGTWKSLSNQYGDAVHTWYTREVPLSQLPLDQVRRAASAFDDRVKQMIRPGTLCRDADWGWSEESLEGPDLFATLLPHVQAMRGIGRALSLRTRVAIADRDYPKALDHIRMNYRIGHDTSKEHFVVSGLVGIAIVGMAHQDVIELIGAPDSPNLYWALSELPDQVVDCRESIREEYYNVFRICPQLVGIEIAEHSPEEWRRLFDQVVYDFMKAVAIGNVSNLGMAQQEVWRQLTTTGLGLVAYPEAKQRLIASGRTKEEVEQMAVAQVLLIDGLQEYLRVGNDVEKWLYVPYRDARVRMHSAEQAIQRTPTNFGHMIASMLLPALDAARTAQARQEWQMKALITLEAVRMHAAEKGRFPRTLDQIQEVPVPDNPLTGQHYEYRLEGEKAVLELPFSDGMPGVSWRFELTLADGTGGEQ